MTVTANLHLTPNSLAEVLPCKTFNSINVYPDARRSSHVALLLPRGVSREHAIVIAAAINAALASVESPPVAQAAE